MYGFGSLAVGAFVLCDARLCTVLCAVRSSDEDLEEILVPLVVDAEGMMGAYIVSSELVLPGWKTLCSDGCRVDRGVWLSCVR